MAACFAAKGFNVIGVDIDQNKVDAINQHVPPVQETGLLELLQEPGICLRATTDVTEAVLNTDVTFVVTATPSERNGRFSLQYVLSACEDIGTALKNKDQFHVVVITSTVMPGDCDGKIKDCLEKSSGKICGEQFGLVYNPEFIALGSVIKDFLHPDFVLVGVDDPLSDVRITQIYESCIASPVIKSMSRINAELTKISLNSYITTKISFANLLARICEQIPGTDVDVVTDAIGSDSRIGNKYLKGAVSYGGPCFPRDNRALFTLVPWEQVTGGMDIPEAVDTFNRSQIPWLADFIQEKAPCPVKILGLAYKPNTDVLEESAGMLVQEELLRRCPSAICGSWEKAKTVVVMLPCSEYKDLDYSGKTVIDCWRILPHLADCPDVDYIALGRG